MNTSVNNKVVLITGAASGIGAATARLFARSGARVVLSDINGQALDQLGAELGVPCVVADVSDESQVAAAVAYAVACHGRLDCMINNAGMIGVVGSILDTDASDWRRTMAVLLDGVFYGIKHAGRQMRAQGSGGTILQLSSLAGVSGGLGPQAYSAAKAAVIALTRGAASELARHGIRVNAVAPDLVVTPLVDQVYGDRQQTRQKAAAKSPLGSPIEADEIAKTLLYLASDAAFHVSAHTVVIDSGISQAGSVDSHRIHARPAGFVGTLPTSFE